MKLVTIVIPIYKTDFSHTERISLLRTFSIFEKFPITIICPKSLDVSEAIINCVGNKEFIVVPFDDNCFVSIKSYNRLMVSSSFYSSFLQYTYLLVCQLDAFVFKNDLAYWCNADYDYIGAPWIGSKATIINKILRCMDGIFRRIKGKTARNWEHLFKVGNGGFSLRKVKSHYEISREYSNLIEGYLNDSNSIYSVEDIFWSLKAPQLRQDFKIPNYIKAVAFAIDRKPDLAIKLNNGELPFACHGFDKPKVKDFWMPIIEKQSK